MLPGWGFRLHLSLGDPKTDHSGWLPTSPDAPDASDVIQQNPYRWRNTSGEHSFTASDMLKRFLSSKVFRVPSSTIQLSWRSCQFFFVAASGCSSHGTELSGLVVIGETLPPVFATSSSWLHWVGTYWCTNCPIRLDPSALRHSGAVGNTTRNRDIPKTWVTVTPSGMVMLLRPRVTWPRWQTRRTQWSVEPRFGCGFHRCLYLQGCFATWNYHGDTLK